MSLNDRQARFVHAYALSGNGSKAAREAGYSPRTAGQMGFELLKKPDVVEALSAYRKGIEAEFNVSKQRVLEELQSAIELAKIQGDAGAMIAGWREVAKICGYYSPERVKVDVDISGKRFIDRLEQMTDAELLRISTSVEHN